MFIIYIYSNALLTWMKQLFSFLSQLIPVVKQKEFLELFRKYFNAVRDYLVVEHKAMHKRERRNRDIIFSRGEISEERRAENEAAQKAYDKLLTNTSTLAVGLSVIPLKSIVPVALTIRHNQTTFEQILCYLCLVQFLHGLQNDNVYYYYYIIVCRKCLMKTCLIFQSTRLQKTRIYLLSCSFLLVVAR